MRVWEKKQRKNGIEKLHVRSVPVATFAFVETVNVIKGVPIIPLFFFLISVARFYVCFRLFLSVILERGLKEVGGLNFFFTSIWVVFLFFSFHLLSLQVTRQPHPFYSNCYYLNYFSRQTFTILQAITGYYVFIVIQPAMIMMLITFDASFRVLELVLAKRFICPV